MFDLWLSQIIIKNFKGIKSIKLSIDKRFNVFIGKNNIGKSTVFEAILLWYKCFNVTIKKNKKEFYQGKAKIFYIPFEEIDFMRIVNDKDLFFKQREETIIIELVFNNEFKLGFKIESAKKIRNSFLRVSRVDENEFHNFSKHFNMDLSEMIFIYQTRPLSNILKHEPLLSKGFIAQKIANGFSQEVLRNKIIKKSEEEKRMLEKDLTELIGEDIEFEIPTKKKLEKEAFIELRVNGKDIYLYGSGFLQLLEILSTISYIEAPLKILLIDEPDSHIHSILQDNLMNYLKSLQDMQIFVITHNDRFVTNVDKDNLFYITKSSEDNLVGLQFDDNTLEMMKQEIGGIIYSLGVLDKANELIFVEGDDDIEYIKLMAKKLNKSFNDKFFLILRGRDDILKKVTYIYNSMNSIKKIRNKKVIFDKDFTLIEKADKLAKDLRKGFYHNGYCIESVLFEDFNILSEFLACITNLDNKEILEFIKSWQKNIYEDLSRVDSSLYSSLKESFKGQKKPSRPELKIVDFDDFIKEVKLQGSISFVMNKSLIKMFIKDFEKKFEVSLFDKNEDSEEFYSSCLLSLYINTLDRVRLYNSYEKLLKFIEE